jgi:hypothetical protein
MKLIQKLSIGRRVAGAGSLLLLLFMFLPWFGTKDEYTPNGILLPAKHVTVNAWRPWEHEWPVAVLLPLCVAIVLFSIFRGGGRASPRLRATASVVAAAAGAAAATLVVYRVLVPIPNVVRWYGLFLAMLAALAMLYGGLRWMDEEGAEVAGYTVADAKRRLREATRRIRESRQR